MTRRLEEIFATEWQGKEAQTARLEPADRASSIWLK